MLDTYRVSWLNVCAGAGGHGQVLASLKSAEESLAVRVAISLGV